jgi:phosphoribosyl 1,2-cyclic phosphodiesterase/DNA-binding response OmpR family regulator
MQVRFWGTRGSLAKPGPSTVRYGGNTSCVQVTTSSGTLIVIDCGTGGHELGAHLAKAGKPIRGHMLISHTHWDHIQGIPFFAPFFMPGNKWDLYAPQGFGDSLRDTLAGQMEYTYFPVTPDAFAAEMKYNSLSEGSFRIDDVTVRTRFLNHPALTLAYRIEADGVAIVYACDHEPHSRALAMAEGPITGQDKLHADFLAGADLVIHDAQYTAEEYGPKVGWGHSTHEYVVTICDAVGVKRLALSHHDPLRSDEALDRLVERDRASLGPDSALDVFAAAEGMILELDAPVALVSDERGDDEALNVDRGRQVPLLLVATADATVSEKLQQAIEAEPVQLVKAATGETALRLLESEHPSLVIIDDNLPDGKGTELTKSIRSLAGSAEADLPIMIVSPEASPGNGSLGKSTDWLQTPFSGEYARARIRTWLMRGQFRWLRAPIHEGEKERLAALRSLNLLDTEAEERFDRYTRIAAALFDVPVALVTLVDEDRQWFKSCIGTQECETSREVSFCAHALKQHEVMVVPDALADPRFADNPIVVGGPRIRFYAGAPLHLPGGHCVGTLCIIDHRPRQITNEQVKLLEDLGKLVEKELVAGPETPVAA